MAKLTVSSIRSQIAALEAKAAHLTKLEMKASVDKVKTLMASLGLTVEHLGGAVSSSAKAVKKVVLGEAKAAPSKKVAAKRAGAGTVKYRHPTTGATWTGFGRPPAWLAEAKNREQYLVDKGAVAAKTAATPSAPAKKSAKKVASKVATKVAKKAAGKAVGTVKPAAKKAAASKAAPAKKRGAAKPVAKKAAPRKVATKKAPSSAAAESSAPAEGAAAS